MTCLPSCRCRQQIASLTASHLCTMGWRSPSLVQGKQAAGQAGLLERCSVCCVDSLARFGSFGACCEPRFPLICAYGCGVTYLLGRSSQADSNSGDESSGSKIFPCHDISEQLKRLLVTFVRQAVKVTFNRHAAAHERRAVWCAATLGGGPRGLGAEHARTRSKRKERKQLSCALKASPSCSTSTATSTAAPLSLSLPATAPHPARTARPRAMQQQRPPLPALPPPPRQPLAHPRCRPVYPTAAPPL